MKMASDADLALKSYTSTTVRAVKFGIDIVSFDHLALEEFVGK